MAEERDVRFVTEESFDFGILSPSDSQEEEEDEESPAGAGARGGSGRWSPLSGARLEEMVREATRLAAQLEQCHLPPPAPPGPPPNPRSPRSPRRETFVVKDSPVRALLPTVESRGTPPPAATTTTRPPAKPRGPPAATSIPSTRKVSPSCHPTAAPKGPPRARVPPPSRVGPPPRPCPPQGQGAGARGKSEPLQAGTSGTGSAGGDMGSSLGWGHPRQGLGCPHCTPTPSPPHSPLSPGQSKVRGAAAPCPPAARQPRTRATTVPSSRPPAPSAIPRAPGRTPAGGAAAGGRAPAPRGGGVARTAPPAAGSGCKPGPPSSRLRPPRKTAVSSTPR
ncbi:LOW QUALITY PROTEIN: proline/serine-rich coiled-coil protein 1 [Athene noctua]|uniref:LOW QUALITY PROTEIN: proline/serine-rich coiled-coil protein 1 n=1 Tax=Athene noctua TaxID=126797 RepID=UPI003EBB3612